MLKVFNEWIKAIENHEPVVLATVIDVKGASPAQLGFKLLARPDGSYIGNVGSGELERRVIGAAKESLLTGKCTTVHYALKEEGSDSIGMLCGCDVTVFVEPFLTKACAYDYRGGGI